ncbi:ASCH/PUA domain-containing protein [Caulobacter sp. LjRoot300]|uniref:ASCH/PUA domain-containing protein n=1 Tax=Caulobacter sp. LjRoot300 TaxID=3342321 RepID=UPI003ECD091B
MTRHELKTWPQYFAAVRSGKKRFEIRRNDREFAVGDVLVLREFDPEQDAYTGQVEERQITFLLSEEDYGVIHGFVAIGFGEVVHHGDMPADGALTAAQLAHWHETTSNNAALRAQDARKVAQSYAAPTTGRAAMPVAADRHSAVAAAAEAEAAFHAAAARIVRGK